ncbi:MAG TPA: hypothetical protein VH558_03535 [Pseudolabrys sp.]|jgi:hypothetical protein
MVASTLTRQSDPLIPNVVCPKCGSRMGLTTIEPAGNDDNTITFDCICGNRYQLSQRAVAALARDSSDRW